MSKDFTPPKISKTFAAAVTAQQMIEVDRLMMREFNIPLITMMETTGTNLADLAQKRFLNTSPENHHVVCMAGNGGNGGGALAAARILAERGVNVRIALARDFNEMTQATQQKLTMLQAMNVKGTFKKAVPETLRGKNGRCDLIIDGLIGYSLKGNPHGLTADLIQWANTQNTPVLSVDLPSGMEATDGMIYEPAIKATATMTIALPKTGLLNPKAQSHIGELYLSNLNVPAALYEKMGLPARSQHLFKKGNLLRVEP